MIVFFGSARAPSPSEAKVLKKENPNNPVLKMAKYYEATEKGDCHNRRSSLHKYLYVFHVQVGKNIF